jgi:hypothetical protein
MQTNKHVFLTGKAGTGKTTFLKLIKEKTRKKTAIVAPTGVAAMNAGGVTIHSFFQLPITYFIPENKRGFQMSNDNGTDLHTLLANIKLNKERRKIIFELELLVIDEVSMLRADLLDAIDNVLRHFRKRFDEPFGGVQVLFIGDLYQLPPVVKEDEWHWLSAYYNSLFFFDARVMKDAQPVYIELEHIYRQQDTIFINLLNNIRNNTVDDDDLKHLNKYYDPYFFPEADDGIIMLTSHNYKADKTNQSALAKLQGESFEYEGELHGDFNENALPAEKKLVLKVGAQIMFIRNDKGDFRRYYNGKIATVSRIKKDEVYVKFKNQNEEMMLEKEVWENIRYNYNETEDKLDENVLGTYAQYPIKLAWAVTIHKSQGLTFEKAIIDAEQSFAPGQVYVALSRLTSLSGLVLSSPISASVIQTESRIVGYSQHKLPIEVLQQELQRAQFQYLGMKLLAIYNFEKVLRLILEHHEGYNSIRLPHQMEAVRWSAEVVKSIQELFDVGEKFNNQLKRLLPSSTQDNYTLLLQRISSAQDYFLKELEEKFFQKWKEHYDATVVKAKTKKYLKSMQILFSNLHRKRQEIEQSSLLVNGLKEGENLSILLDNHQTQTQVLPEKNKEIPKEKEDTKNISLRMFRLGKNITEIAKERGLVSSTIEGHLVSFIPTGEVKINELISDKEMTILKEAIEKSSEKTVVAVKQIVGNDFSYAIVRALLNEKN